MDDVNICTTNVSVSTSNFRPFSSSGDQESQTLTPPTISNQQIQGFHNLSYHQKPIKKRSKWMKMHDDYGFMSVKPKTKKPDPNAPKITPPCSVCGRKFWSWKALFGHMRCHPERQWRGINPPSDFRPTEIQEISGSDAASKSTRLIHRNQIKKMSNNDHEAAGSLLMLANSPPTAITTICNKMEAIGSKMSPVKADNFPFNRTFLQPKHLNRSKIPFYDSKSLLDRFEYSSCNKVSVSNQALRSHRATSHRNIKVCLAKQPRVHSFLPEENARDESLSGHKCSVCLKVFSSGQALAGHKRCHWEKEEEHHDNQPLMADETLIPIYEKEGLCIWDLNFPAPLDDDGLSCSYSTRLAFDLIKTID